MTFPKVPKPISCISSMSSREATASVTVVVNGGGVTAVVKPITSGLAAAVPVAIAVAASCDELISVPSFEDVFA